MAIRFWQSLWSRLALAEQDGPEATVAVTDSTDSSAPLYGHYDYREDSDLAPFLTGDVLSLSQSLADCGMITAQTYDAVYQERFEDGKELVIGQAEYGPQHRERFRELFNACAYLLADRPAPRMLEFGTSEFSAMYKRFCPDMVLDLSDRPVAPGYIGFTEAVARRITDCNGYFPVDLTGGAAAVVHSAIPPQAYDLVVFTEVIEHLDVHPVELIEALLGLLKAEGWLYLTTPNFFRRENLARIARFENPQEVYPAGNGNWDGHHHHREYAAKELFRFVEQAGGRTAAFYFSACWDSDADLPAHERANLVFVIQPVRA